MKNKLKIVATIFTFLIASLVKGQSFHFSQFINSPLTTNPANSGFIPDGDYRVGINYRDQWSNIMAVPYKTMSVFGDAQIFRNRFETGWLGAGGVLLHDVAGSGNLTSTKIFGSLAYHQLIGIGSLVSAGFNVGWANKQIHVNNLKFPDQFDGKFFDNKLPTSVSLNSNNINYLDVQVGLNYAYFPNERTYINAGFSTQHVNQPRESFFIASLGIDNRVPLRHSIFLNGSFLLNNQWMINPNIYFTSQTKSVEMVGGFNAQYNLSGDGEYQLIAGVYYRHKESVIPMMGLMWKGLKAIFSFDATTSSMNLYNNGRGALEFSIIKQGLLSNYLGNKKQLLCPSFRN